MPKVHHFQTSEVTQQAFAMQFSVSLLIRSYFFCRSFKYWIWYLIRCVSGVSQPFLVFRWCLRVFRNVSKVLVKPLLGVSLPVNWIRKVTPFQHLPVVLVTFAWEQLVHRSLRVWRKAGVVASVDHEDGAIHMRAIVGLLHNRIGLRLHESSTHEHGSSATIILGREEWGLERLPS